jgi:hypothetical protein
MRTRHLHDDQRRPVSRRRLFHLGWAGLLGVGIACLQSMLQEFVAEAPTLERGTSMPNIQAAPSPVRVAVQPSPAPPAPTPTIAATPTIGAKSRQALHEQSDLSIHLPVSRPPIIAHAAWGAVTPTRAFVPQHPRQITLHHEGVYFDGSTPAPVYLQHVQRWSIHDRGWPDIPYHFLIDLEGRMYEGRPLDARGDTNTSYNLQDHALVAVLGKYDSGEQEPNQTQIDSIIALMAWVAERYQIAPEHIHGHRDFIPLNSRGEHIDIHTGEKITCPGDNLYRYLHDRTIQDGVARMLTRTIHLNARNAE